MEGVLELTDLKSLFQPKLFYKSMFLSSLPVTTKDTAEGGGEHGRMSLHRWPHNTIDRHSPQAILLSLSDILVFHT